MAIHLLAHTLGKQNLYRTLANRLIHDVPYDWLQNASIYYVWAVALDPTVLSPESRAKVERVVADAASSSRGKGYGDFSAAHYLVGVKRDREALALLLGMSSASSFEAMRQALIAIASARLGDEARYRQAIAEMRTKRAALEQAFAKDPYQVVWDQRVVLNDLAEAAEKTPVARPKVPPDAPPAFR